MPHPSSFDADEGLEPDVAPLTAAQAQALRESEPALSPWRVVGIQCIAGFLVAMVAWGVVGQPIAGWSAAYGAIAVIIPAALFARGVMSRFSSMNAATANFGFFVWQAAKIAMSVAMIAAAPKLFEDLNWLAMMAGLAVTLKMYWLALLMRPKRKTNLRA